MIAARRWRRALTLSALVVLCSLTTTSSAGVTPDRKCQQGKNLASGKYAACLAKAEKAFLLNGDVPRYNDARLRCEESLAARFDRLEATANAAGVSCRTVGDAPTVRGFVQACSDTIAAGIDGGPFLIDPQWCPVYLGVCEYGRTECALDLLACSSRADSCEANLARCQSLTCDGLPDGVGVPKTGQTVSFGPGSDGSIQAGTARSFTDNGDGTITDEVTGLMWEKKDDAGGLHDKDNAYQYCGSTVHEDACYWVAPSMNGDAVNVFLAAMNAGSGFAGHTDWRIPNRLELETLLDLNAYDPATYAPFTSGCAPGCDLTTCSCTTSGEYLSSTTFPTEPGYAASVSFLHGVSAAVGKSDPAAVRAVREGH